MKDNSSKNDVSFIFQITDKVLWNVFKKNEIGGVLLPFIVIRRLDCILEKVNAKVRTTYKKYKESSDEAALDKLLKKSAGGLQFYNTSDHSLESLISDPKSISMDFYAYINGFNPEVKDIIENFQFDKVIARLVKNKLLFQMVSAICQVDLHTSQVSNHQMGYLFEELIRLSNEQSNETAGEHFTPRDVIELMIKIVFSTEKERLQNQNKIYSIYDPTMGTGGMVNLAKDYVRNELFKAGTKPEIATFGQEINEQSYAIAKSEALITGENVDNIRHGNTLTDDRFAGKTFDYIFANPPYGVTWSKDAEAIRSESAKLNGRFGAGLPATSDGQLLFIQHMISKLSAESGKMAVVTNGSPLFSGVAGSGESNIRKWIIGNDWLDCILALPKDLFYNTGINTYIWFLDKNKPTQRKGKVQLINANVLEDRVAGIKGFSRPEKKAMGNKRNKIDKDHIASLLEIYSSNKTGEYSKILQNESFGYYQVTVERPAYSQDGTIIVDKKGRAKVDSSKRDKEIIALSEDIDVYFGREVLPYANDAFIDFSKTKIGYEINFVKQFYKYQVLRPAADIKKEIEAIEFGTDQDKGISQLLKELLD